MARRARHRDVGAVLLGTACLLPRDALGTATTDVPPASRVALAAPHLVALVARSEAWRLSLVAIGGSSPGRSAVHTATRARSSRAPSKLTPRCRRGSHCCAASLPAAAAAVVALGVFELLPLGPSAPPGALLVVSGGAGALAAGWR